MEAPAPKLAPSVPFMTTSTGTRSGSTKFTTPTLHFLKSTALARQVLLERKIDDFSHKEAGDAITAVAARFPHSDVSDDSDLDSSR